MYFITQGSGYSAALDFSRQQDSVILDLHRMDTFNGIIPKIASAAEIPAGAEIINLSNGVEQFPGDIGASPLGFSVNGYSDVNLRIAQEISLKIPALYKTEPTTPSVQVGKTTWLEIKPGTEYSVRGYWTGDRFTMFAITGRWNRALAGDVGPMLSGAICTGFSILDHENPLRSAFDKLGQYILDKHDRFRGPIYITVVDDGTHLWYKDLYFGFRFPEEYVLTRLASPETTYLGTHEAFGKGYALSMAVTLYDKDVLNLDNVSPAEARMDNLRVHPQEGLLPTAFKVGYVVGKEKTFADAAADAVEIAQKICPNFGYRTDAGKRAKEWYYHVRKRIKG